MPSGQESRPFREETHEGGKVLFFFNLAATAVPRVNNHPNSSWWIPYPTSKVHRQELPSHHRAPDGNQVFDRLGSCRREFAFQSGPPPRFFLLLTSKYAATDVEQDQIVVQCSRRPKSCSVVVLRLGMTGPCLSSRMAPEMFRACPQSVRACPQSVRVARFVFEIVPNCFEMLRRIGPNLPFSGVGR